MTLTRYSATLPFSAPDFLLRRGPYSDRPEVWSLDFGSSERHEPGLFVAAIPPDTDLADRLAAELAFRNDRPGLILIGPDADPFSPRPDVQHEVARIIEVLAERGIVAWLATRGTPLPTLMETLARHRQHVRVTVSLATLDQNIQRVIEPHAAPTEERLALIAELNRRDVPVEVNLDPLLPGLTDTRDKLWLLLEQLAAFDVRQVTAGYLVLRPGVRERLRAALDPHGWAEVVLGAYHDGPIFRDGPNPAAQYLSKAKRQRGYAALMTLASEFEVSARLSSLANPDFRPPRQPDTARARAMIQALRQSARNVRAVGA